MQLFPKFEIRSFENIVRFLNEQNVGRIASIDHDGYPQIIPMNFVFVKNDVISSENRSSGFIYMHSHPRGEKIDNVIRNPKSGFEVDLHVCFLPSYYFHPSDASQADTLYISVVIKGTTTIVLSTEEKALALNALMQKYQKEGHYEPLNSTQSSVHEVTVLKLTPDQIRGKYKLGQHWSHSYRLEIAKKIVNREREAKEILSFMGIDILPNDELIIKKDPVM
jgi:nitroimidazol reductase NimA-like FMN-containing flavoprotein (pyridoxamine 5'-phosphate oxidase superfamily)